MLNQNDEILNCKEYEIELNKVTQCLDYPKEKRTRSNIDLLYQFFSRFKCIREMITKHGSEFFLNFLCLLEYKNYEFGQEIVELG